ncbi:putative ABC-type branched-chain amino acid transport systems, periplasmic component [Magnetospirillum gryphiswaldense MSR-1 v2]|uniref:ABC-type branched-chain amino acid transport systems, periplasmic component n=1 Tax=Magnetospirillum gryphiswaldense (strain DSM 6361 / JCM 21280 / NBRC 15271 / MSR-1) TaxID=431944 RepID=V6F546_MAGGM|nr:putative ABC-type branched-chain amino acid transport systems, periplasmic component [Magnetospirillum gryphiswaldense MSR-1 v2]
MRSEPLPPALPPVPTPMAGASFQGREEIRAALLVPLSGPYAAWGQAMSNAAQMALFDVADERLNLIPLDTKGTPEGAVAALEQARTQGADIILGPVFSPEVKAVAPQARAWGIPLVSFTTDRSMLGQGIYTLGFLPESQIQRVVIHARSQGKQRFALLARADEYGQAVAEAFRNVVPQVGGQVAKVEFYDPQAKDVSNTIKRFTESDARTRGRDRKEVGAIPPPPFDAVLIADEGTRLRTVSSLVTYYEVDIDKVPLLGTMLWDDPRLAAEPSLQGAWFAAPAAEGYAEFERRYAAAFGSRPPRAGTLRASLAYDATALAAALVRQNLDYSAATLTNSGGFAGMDGLFRLRADGTVERGLAVREIAKAGIRDIAPSPTSFAQPGM